MAGGADDGQGLTGGDAQGQPVDDPRQLAALGRDPFVGEAHVAELDLAARARQIDGVGAVGDLGRRVEQQEDALARGAGVGELFEEVADLLHRAEEHEDVPDALREVAGGEMPGGDLFAADHHQDGDADGEKHGAERWEPAPAPRRRHHRAVEIRAHQAIAPAVLVLAHGLLDDAHAVDRLDQMGDHPATIFGGATPQRAARALEGDHRQEQRRRDGAEVPEQARGQPVEHHPRSDRAQDDAQQFGRPIDHRAFQAVDVAIGARDDAPSLGAVEVAHTQALDVGEDARAQIVEHADGDGAVQPLGDARQAEADQPGRHQPETHQCQEADGEIGGRAADAIGAVDDLAKEPRPEEDRDDDHRLDRHHRQDAPAHRLQQRDQPGDDPPVEPAFGEVLFDVEITHGRRPRPSSHRGRAGRGRRGRGAQGRRGGRSRRSPRGRA